MNGILNINKPYGKTSFDIVATVRGLTGERRVGHAGTLDPAATGVLPVCLGQGTRVIEFLVDSTKTYQAQIELGMATDTYDASGKVTQKGDISGIDQAQLELALASFCGLIQQIPPMYSAVKHQGKPLYEWARAGIEVERKSRWAKIYRIELLDWQPPVVTVEVVCGKGTYIRSIAHDMGQALGCGANLKSLIRLRCGLFDIKDAVSVSQLDDALYHGHWQHLVYPIDSVLSHWTAMVVSEVTSQAIRNGGSFTLDRTDSIGGTGYLAQSSPDWADAGGYCRAYTADGCFLAVLRFNLGKGQWCPEKVFL